MKKATECGYSYRYTNNDLHVNKTFFFRPQTPYVQFTSDAIPIQKTIAKTRYYIFYNDACILQMRSILVGNGEWGYILKSMV